MSDAQAVSLEDLGKELEAQDKADVQANLAQAEARRKEVVARVEGRIEAPPSASMQSQPVPSVRPQTTGNSPSMHTPTREGVRVIGPGDFNINDPTQIECPFIEYRIYRCHDCGHWIHAGGADHKQFVACTAEKCQVGVTPEGKRIPGRMELMLWRKPRPGYENSRAVQEWLAAQAQAK